MENPSTEIHYYCRFHRLEARLTHDAGHARAKFSQPLPACVAALVDYMKLVLLA